MISPAHFFDTAFGGSAHGMEQGGLTAKGREMVRRMEARGVILDVAHSSARTIDDALDGQRRGRSWRRTPACAACSTTRATCPTRTSTGSRRAAASWASASGRRPAGGDDAAAIARSIAYAVERVGVGARGARVGLGRRGAASRSTPRTRSALTDALLDVGLDEAAIRAVMGENVLRVMAAALPAG